VDHRQLLRSVGSPQPLIWSEAVQPAAEVEYHPAAGYRSDVYLNPARRVRVPALAIAADRARLFPLFLALIGRLGRRVDAVLETSHFRSDGKHRDYRRLAADRTVLASYLCEFEDLITEDGCTGVSVIAPGGPCEVHLDEHKTIIVYAPLRRPFARVCRAFGLVRNDDLTLISEVKHVHRSHAEFAIMFRDLTRRLGMTRG
jgi:hypothetical protein